VMNQAEAGVLALALVKLEQRRSVATLLDGASARSAALVCASDGRWFVSGSGVVRLHRRPVLNRIFRVLLDARREHPGRALSREELVAGAWPGERFTAGSGANRLYFNIAMLRGLGLRPYLLRREDGYYLDPNAPLDMRAHPPEFVRVA
jgi:hypothetical protein